VYSQKPPLGRLINYAAFPAAKRLVGCWLMNEKAGLEVKDLSGHGNDGTLASATTWTVGKFGFALGINESAVPVRVTHSESVNIDRNFTISMWFKIPSSALGDNYTLISKYPDNVIYFRCLVLQASGLVYGDFDDNVLKKSVTSTSAVNGGLWHHVVFTRDSSGYKFYLDNVLEDTDTDNGSIANTEDLVLGATGLTAFDDMLGEIEHCMIFDRALTASEIALLYREPFVMFKRRRRVIFAPEVAVGANAPTGALYGSLVGCLGGPV